MTTEFLASYGSALWAVLMDVSVYFLMGLFGAGLIRAFTDEKKIARHIGRNNFASVFKASVMGIPLPLCSCSVVPVALSLRKQGASKGATTSFLISTPESGADSVVVSYALLDPLMTVFRPLAAFITALVAGMAEIWFGVKPASPTPQPTAAAPQAIGLPTDAECGCTGGRCAETPDRTAISLPLRLIGGLKYAFGDLLKDLAPYFLVGLMLAAAVSAFIPERWFTDNYTAEWQGMVMMLALGIPVYVCATASTPVAAAFILKGVSPGAALVFLLAGPATNLATLSVIRRSLGMRSTVIYLIAIATVALLMGILLNAVYAYAGLSVTASIGEAAEWMPEWLRATCALALFLILLWLTATTVYRNFIRHKQGPLPLTNLKKQL